ncbi:Ldh family oxidoreductase [Thermoanaerobacteraceae bacterium SP2]|nr:Ldh family oxidoreductase [Thermoanaerobacteraceae bacterium SP2]
MADEVKFIQADILRDYCSQLLQKVGVPEDHSRIVADSLVEADLTGVESHGVTRMAVYMKRLRNGGINPVLELKTVMDGPGTAVVDACHSIGQVTSYKVMEMAIEKAKKVGISFISVKNSDHFGAAGYFAKMALPHNMIGFSGTNGAARMAPWGGREPLFGTNPFAMAIPAGKQLPIVADMASCVVARGKIILANKKKQPIPLGWAITKDGEDTTDAQEALKGTLLPFGGPKGSAIAIIVETLTGILAGSLMSSQLVDMASNPSTKNPVSHYFGAIDIAAFGPVEEFKEKVDQMILSVKRCAKAKNVTEIFLPGEIEERKKQKRLKEGIPVPRVILDELKREGEACGIPYTLE